MVADAGVRDGSGKNIGDGLQVHGGKAAVRSSNATNPGLIYKRMLLAELLGSLNYVLRRAVAGGVHVAGGKLLAETGGSAWVHNINYISHSSIQMVRVAALKVALCRAATSVVVYNQRIFFVCIKKLCRQEN